MLLVVLENLSGTLTTCTAQVLGAKALQGGLPEDIRPTVTKRSAWYVLKWVHLKVVSLF